MDIHALHGWTYLCGSICRDIKSSSLLKCVWENSTALSDGSIGGGRAPERCWSKKDDHVHCVCTSIDTVCTQAILIRSLGRAFLTQRWMELRTYSRHHVMKQWCRFLCRLLPTVSSFPMCIAHFYHCLEQHFPSCQCSGHWKKPTALNHTYTY